MFRNKKDLAKSCTIITSCLVIVVFTWLTNGCEKETFVQPYQTENVFILVVDGARYTETWGDQNHQYIPHRAELLKQGVLCDQFYNNGFTETCQGHQAICTGVYENINNSGLENPSNPTIFQYWLKKTSRPNLQAWVIASKDKLEILSDCVNPQWKGTYKPSTDCGNNGLFTGYREDSITFKKLKLITSQNHVRLAIINFKQPDAAGHSGNYEAYKQGILDTDQYVYDFWNYLQNNPVYKDKTTLIVTNDHGRHSEGHLDGFVSHGDLCEGCRHVEFFGLGPDFKKNYVCSTTYQQIDIAKTVAQLLGFEMPTASGKVMAEILK
ncbi:MAG: alkaline phosphatase [Bacteroidetes bacterium]|nr:alkaline phosphatase [Bacteroidota bacterium]